MKESQLAVLQKYLVDGETTWEDVAKRVSRFVASAEPEDTSFWQSTFEEMIVNQYFMPGGSILANSDHGTRGANNCFTLAAGDNMQSIADLVHDCIMTTNFRGGIGLGIGKKGEPNYIRPKGSKYKDGEALGPVAVLEMISENDKKLTTGNKSRRGAHLAWMHWSHPDIDEFIQVKTKSKIDADLAQEHISKALSSPTDYRQSGLPEQWKESWNETHLHPNGKRERVLHNFNISVGLDDEFFRLLDQGDPVATELEGEIAKYAWKTADPGLLLLDNIKRKTPIGDFFVSCNPCGEYLGPPDTSCCLGSLVLPKFIQPDGTLDESFLIKTVKNAVRFLDDVLSVSHFATEKQRVACQEQFRQVGLGVIGWADYLKKRGIAYASEENLAEINRVGRLISSAAYKASEDLAVEKGVCGAWDLIKDKISNPDFESWVGGVQTPRRNACLMAIAPTGSIAQLADSSWSIEPDFALTIYKQIYVDASKLEQEWVKIVSPFLDDLNLSASDENIVLATGSLKDTQFASYNPELAKVYETATEISPEWHIKVQAAWQHWIDMSISKTCNMPASATVQDIKDAYSLAHKLGVKGFTVYRSGTLESEPIKVGNDSQKSDPPVNPQDEDDYRTCKSRSCEI